MIDWKALESYLALDSLNLELLIEYAKTYIKYAKTQQEKGLKEEDFAYLTDFFMVVKEYGIYPKKFLLDDVRTLIIELEAIKKTA